jgi:predicted porin
MPTNLYGLASVSKGNTSYFALGSSYDYKDIKLSLGYFNSDSLWMSPGSAASGKKPNNFQNYSLGADYSIIKNFTSYAEINKFKFINKDLSHTYRGYVSVLGLKYKF